MRRKERSLGALVAAATDDGARLRDREGAFCALVARFQDMAFACAVAALRDVHQAEDAAQEAFVIAWERLRDLREPAAFPGWLRRVVLRQCERMRRTPRAVSLSDLAAVAARTVGPQEAAEMSATRDCVRQAVASLPEPERQAVALFYGAGHSTAEIASLLETTPGAIRQRLHTARKRLRERIPITMVEDEIREQRPSRDDAFVNKVAARLRPFHVEDWKAVREVALRTRPDDVVGVENWVKYRREFDGKNRFRRQYAAVGEKTGKVIGYGALEQQADDPGWLRIDLFAAPDAPAGVREALYDRLEEDARAAGAHTLWAREYADEQGFLAFVAARGFIETGRMSDLRLDVESVKADEDAPLPDGFTITTLAQTMRAAPDRWAETLAAWSNPLRAEIGLPNDFPPVTPEQARRWAEREGQLPEASYAVLDGTRCVAISSLSTASELPEGLRHELLGVVTSHRGRGIEAALIRRHAATARTRGCRVLRLLVPAALTDLSAALRAAGYVEKFAYVRLEKRLIS
jgi:RNA polymerase sigma-70 factor (ECF subfamily)